jgi:hypothetical protein
MSYKKNISVFVLTIFSLNLAWCETNPVAVFKPPVFTKAIEKCAANINFVPAGVKTGEISADLSNLAKYWCLVAEGNNELLKK